jgi:ELWxxDGT repeat protein
MPNTFVLFNGGRNLWVTDGTAQGTSELSVTGADAVGLNPGANPGANSVFNPIVFIVVGSEVLFPGEDASGDWNLWVTNGTGPGTSELSGRGSLFEWS